MYVKIMHHLAFECLEKIIQEHCVYRVEIAGSIEVYSCTEFVEQRIQVESDQNNIKVTKHYLSPKYSKEIIWTSVENKFLTNNKKDFDRCPRESSYMCTLDKNSRFRPIRYHVQSLASICAEICRSLVSYQVLGEYVQQVYAIVEDHKGMGEHIEEIYLDKKTAKARIQRIEYIQGKYHLYSRICYYFPKGNYNNFLDENLLLIPNSNESNAVIPNMEYRYINEIDPKHAGLIGIYRILGKVILKLSLRDILSFSLAAKWTRTKVRFCWRILFERDFGYPLRPTPDEYDNLVYYKKEYKKRKTISNFKPNKNKYGNLEDSETRIVFQLDNDEYVAVGIQNSSFNITQLNESVILPLDKIAIQTCKAKCWKYDTSLNVGRESNRSENLVKENSVIKCLQKDP
jgi:hypothetical protein